MTLPLLGVPSDEDSIVADPALAAPLLIAMERFATFIRTEQAEAS